MAKNKEKGGEFKVDFICIGPERSGTTWLYQCMKEHPEICVSEPKEVNFFNTTQSFWRKDLVGQTNYTKGIEWYEGHFNHCLNKKIVGEFTPIYLHSPEVPERIHYCFPEVKLIAILRNPIERIYSHYMYTVLKGAYHLPSFEEVIENQKEFIEDGYYFKHLQNYLKYFPREQILIMIYEDIEKNPQKFIKEVFSFVGAYEDFVPPSLSKTINPAGGVAVRNKLLNARDILKKLPGGETLINLFKKTPFHAKVRKSILSTRTGTFKASYGSISPQTRLRLAEFYLNDTKKLEQFLGRDLSFWS